MADNMPKQYHRVKLSGRREIDLNSWKQDFVLTKKKGLNGISPVSIQSIHFFSSVFSASSFISFLSFLSSLCPFTAFAATTAPITPMVCFLLAQLFISGWGFFEVGLQDTPLPSINNYVVFTGRLAACCTIHRQIRWKSGIILHNQVDCWDPFLFDSTGINLNISPLK